MKQAASPPGRPLTLEQAEALGVVPDGALVQRLVDALVQLTAHACSMAAPKEYPEYFGTEYSCRSWIF